MILNIFNKLNKFKSNKFFLHFFKSLIIIVVIFFFYNNIDKNIFVSLLNSNNFNFNILFILFITIFTHLFISSVRWYLLLNISEKYKNFKRVYYVSIYGYLSDQISVIALFISRYVLLTNGPSPKNITISSIIEKGQSFVIKILFVIPSIIYLLYIYFYENFFLFTGLPIFIFLIIFFLIFNFNIFNINFVIKKYFLSLNFHKSIIISIFLYIINIFSFILIFYFFRIEFDILDILIYLPLALLVSSLQFIFGQIGIRELAFYIVFKNTNIGTEEILLISIFYTMLYTISLILLTFSNFIIFKLIKKNDL